MLKKTFIILAVFAISSIFATSHTWTSQLLVNQVYVNQGTETSNPYARVSLSDGSSYVFDITTTEGQKWLSTLEGALTSGKYVQIRYIPGITQTFYYINNSSGSTSTDTQSKAIGVAVNR